MTGILKSLSAMTPEWLQQQLRLAGHTDANVTSVQVRPMDGFVGAMGEVGIVSTSYGKPSGGLPASFVAKCPLDDDIARMYASVMLSYQREAGFYSDLAGPVTQRTPMTIPHCFVNLFDAATHDATLVIEHIHPAEKGDILQGTNFERMHTLVGDLARLHGAFWMDNQLSELDWLIDWMSPSLRIGIPFTLDSWTNIRNHFAHFHPDDIVELVEDVFLADVEGWLQRFADRTWTLAHQDYELDNVVFRPDGPVILDWQTVMRSFPGLDLGWLLMASHNEETLEREPELLEHYRHQLAESGGPQWSEEDLKEDLAWAAFYWVGVSHVPFMHSVPAGETDRAHRRFKKMMLGTISAAKRWQAVERMRAHNS